MMRCKGKLIFLFFLIIIFSPYSFAHLDAGEEKVIDDYLIDLGYAPESPKVTDKVTLAFNLINNTTKEVIEPTSVWIRISSPKEVVFAGTFHPEAKNIAFTYTFPYADDYSLESIAAIADHTRKEMKSEDSKISDMISTRASVEMAELIYDGFTLAEAAEVVIYPYFSDDGGTNSERTYIQQLVQKYIKDENSEDQYDNKEVTNDLEYKDVDDS